MIAQKMKFPPFTPRPPQLSPSRDCFVTSCEGVKRLKQSPKNLKPMRLPRSLRSLAMTKRHCATVSKGGRGLFDFFRRPSRVFCFMRIRIDSGKGVRNYTDPPGGLSIIFPGLPPFTFATLFPAGKQTCGPGAREIRTGSRKA